MYSEKFLLVAFSIEQNVNELFDAHDHCTCYCLCTFWTVCMTYYSDWLKTVSVQYLLTPYSSEKWVVAGHRGQFTPGGYLSTVNHTALAGIEPTTFRLSGRRATSSAAKTTELPQLTALPRLSSWI